MTEGGENQENLREDFQQTINKLSSNRGSAIKNAGLKLSD